MAFPDEALPVTVELFYDAVWNDITSFCYIRDPIKITRGQKNEGSQVEPTSCPITLDNRDGRFSHRNPASPLFGKIGRNTPIRVAVDGDIRAVTEVSVWPQRWDKPGKDIYTPIQTAGILRRLGQGAPELNSALFQAISNHPNLVAYWPGEDAAGSTQTASALDHTPWAIPGAEYAAVDGPSGSDKLIKVVAGQPTTIASVPNHTAGDEYIVQVAWRMDATLGGARQILNVRMTGASPVVEWRVRASNTAFTLVGFDVDDVLIVNASETVHPDLVGQWIRAELRLSHDGDQVFVEARLYTAETIPTILNQLLDSLSVGSTLGRVRWAGVAYGDGTWAQDRFFGHLAVLTGDFFEHVDWDLHSAFHGYTGEPAATRFRRVCTEEGISHEVIAPDPVPLNGNTGFEVDTSGWISSLGSLVRSTAEAFEGAASGLLTPTGGNPFADASIASASAVPVTPGVEYQWSAWVLSPNGWTDVQLYIEWIDATGATFSFEFSDANVIPAGVWTQLTFSAIPSVIEDLDARLASASIRIADSPAATDTLFIDQAEFVRADSSTPMGPQPIGTLLDLLGEVATVDLGILYEPRATLGLAYRTRADLENQTAALELPYEGVFRELPEPVDDDQQTRNDITVKRPGGSSARAILATGPLSILAPPDGVGTYDTSIEVNVPGDGFLANQASWRLHLGTVDEARYPRLPLDLGVEAFTENAAALQADAAALDVGDRLTVADPPAWLPPDEISQLALGFTELLGNNEWHITINAAPESPYQVGEYESAAGGTYRYDTAGSSLAAAFDAGTDTSMSVDVDILPLWTTAAGEMPFDIEAAGVRLTVTAIAGASSPQTFTITQTPVNGIVKIIPAGTAVSLWTKARYAL